MSENTHDVLVIGTGQGGKPFASACARAGKRTAIVERAHVGGSCVNHGCTPTKAMVASARTAHVSRRAAEFGVRTGAVDVDLRRVRERTRGIVERFRDGSTKSLEETDGLELVRGEATFVAARTVHVRGQDGAERELSADLVVIDTGLAPVRPPIDGLDEVEALDHAAMLELDEVPAHLLVLGGGYVGVEFAQMFRRFGSAVTVIDRGAHLLSREDADVAAAVEELFADEGIDVRTGTEVRRVRRDGDGVRLDLDGDGAGSLTGSHLLLAAGRRPATQALGLEAAGITTDDDGYITVDERLRTNVVGVYAIGDVKGGPAFTHVAYDDFRILQQNLLHGGDATTRDRPLLYTVFTDPQLGRCGLGEEQAREQGRSVRVAKLAMGKVARAIETGETRGLIKVIVDADDDRILGAAVFGAEGGEMVSMLQIAQMGGLRWQALRDGMFAHPLFAEAWNTVFASFVDDGGDDS